MQQIIDISDIDLENAVICTSHEGAVDWLERNGIYVPRRLLHARPSDVAGKVGIGSAPLYVVASALRWINIDMPKLALVQRRHALTAEDMETAGAMLQEYYVRKGLPIQW